MLSADISSVVSAVLAGVSVKLLDDSLDEEPNPARAAYSTLCICLACITEVRIGAMLFMSAYIIGMFIRSQDARPACLRMGESALVFVACSLAFGVVPLLAALSAVLAVQVADDLMDAGHDMAAKQPNLCSRYGLPACVFAVGCASVASWVFDPRIALLALVGAVAVWVTEHAGVFGGERGKRLVR